MKTRILLVLFGLAVAGCLWFALKSNELQTRINTLEDELQRKSKTIEFLEGVNDKLFKDRSNKERKQQDETEDSLGGFRQYGLCGADRHMGVDSIAQDLQA